MASFLPLASACAISLWAAPAAGPELPPLRVRAQVPAGTYYVGQAIELRVGVIANGESPRVVPPRIDGADVTPIGTDLRPLTASGIGAFVTERNLFVSRFRILPRRAGELLIPPVVARLDGRSGSSPAVRVTVRGIPIAGRPAAFLGGVGAFEVSAEASPATVRPGQALEYRIRMAGPAARGTTGAPDLSRFGRLPLGLRIQPMPAEVFQPPSRVFRFRVWPTRAGAAVLPPVPIASFDPKMARFVSKVTPGVPIRVTEVPAFDPYTLRYGAPAARSPARTGRTDRAAIWMAVAGSLALVAAWLILRLVRTRASGKQAAGRLAAHAGRGLDASRPPTEVARRVADALTVYLGHAAGRPAGALTPDEARSAITEVTDRRELGERAERLVARCDQAQFSGAEPNVEELISEARQLFAELGRDTRRRRGRRGTSAATMRPGTKTERGSPVPPR